MAGKVNVKKLIAYWRQTAEHDYETMLGLKKIKRYSDCLFFGHIVLEKILKALVVAETKKDAPYIHNLAKLAELAKCELREADWNLLDAVNKFNINCRYPDYKMKFYKMCTKEYAEKYLVAIEKTYKLLCQKLK